MADLHWKLEDLPERYRRQVEEKLGNPSAQRITTAPQTPPAQVRPVQPAQRPKYAPKASKSLPTRVSRARTSKHMSHTEERFRDRFCASCGWRVLRYEPLSIWVSGGFRYTPDFLVATENGELAFVETKGSYRLQSHSRARLAFANASTRTPEFVFVWAKEDRKHRNFSLEFWKAGKILHRDEVEHETGHVAIQTKHPAAKNVEIPTFQDHPVSRESQENQESS